VKEVMPEARISGTPAMPKGLRHSLGVNAFETSVPPHLLQRWLGHALLRTTYIYSDVMRFEERAFAVRERSRSHADRNRVWSRNVGRNQLFERVPSMAAVFVDLFPPALKFYQRISGAYI
jgi:hypothetical protein